MKKKLLLLFSIIFGIVSNMNADDFILRCEGRTFFCFSNAATWDPSLQKHIIDLNQCSLLLGEVLCVAPPCQVQVSWIAPDCEGTISGGGGENNTTNYVANILSLSGDQRTYSLMTNPPRPITLESTLFDCSGWVHFVMLQINPDLANSLGQTTATMQSYISSNGGYHSVPVVGDMAMWNTHVEFVVGYDGTYVTLSGARGDNLDPVPTTTGSTWLTLDRMDDINSTGFLGFWTVQ
jgi:hypothetical protein